MVKYRASALLLCLLWICIDLLAQTSPDKVTVEGVVYDQSGFPLIGVNIVEKEILQVESLLTLTGTLV
jgi:hypothetical protein